MNEPLALIATLAQYADLHPDAAATAARISALVAAHADCFERSCRPGHLTGSAWVVSRDGERHLLLLHRKLGKWLQPGGHADGERDLAQVALREAREETGLADLRIVPAASGLAPLDIDVHTIPARYGAAGELLEDPHEHHDVRYLVLAQGDETLRPNAESRQMRWCTPAEVCKLTTEPSVLRLLDKARRRLADGGPGEPFDRVQ